MAELVNVFQPDARKKVEREVPTLDGAFVFFYNDFLANEWQEIMDIEDKERGGYEFTKRMIADWNFADKDGKKLDVTIENIRRLPLKVQNWLANTAIELLNEGLDIKKESPVT